MDNWTNKLIHLLNQLGKSNGKGWDGKHRQPRLEPVKPDQRLDNQADGVEH